MKFFNTSPPERAAHEAEIQQLKAGIKEAGLIMADAVGENTKLKADCAVLEDALSRSNDALGAADGYFMDVEQHFPAAHAFADSMGLRVPAVQDRWKENKALLESTHPGASLVEELKETKKVRDYYKHEMEVLRAGGQTLIEYCRKLQSMLPPEEVLKLGTKEIFEIMKKCE